MVMNFLLKKFSSIRTDFSIDSTSLCSFSVGCIFTIFYTFWVDVASKNELVTICKPPTICKLRSRKVPTLQEKINLV